MESLVDSLDQYTEEAVFARENKSFKDLEFGYNSKICIFNHEQFYRSISENLSPTHH